MSTPKSQETGAATASRTHCATAGAITATSAGLIWAIAYGTGPATLLVICTLHALGGAALGVLLHATIAGVAPPSLASGLGGWLLSFAVPASLGLWMPGDVGTKQATLIAALFGLPVLAAAIGVARLGQAATGFVMVVSLVGAIWIGGQEIESVLPRHPVTDVEAGERTANRVAVIGLDGADWRVIDPLMAAGVLPNLARLVSLGRSADLVSFDPSYSPVVWTTIFSGRLPADHGITDWSTSHAANRRRAVLWEMLAAAGDASVVVNVPGTWPPTSIEGAMVAGFPIPSALLRPDRDQIQNVGSVVALESREGPLRTVVAQPDGDDVLRARVSLGEWIPRRRGRLRHFLIDYVSVRGWLPAPVVEVDFTIQKPDEGTALEVGIGPHRVALAPRAWSPWLEIGSVAGPLQIRVRRLDDDALWVTPAFQSPGDPIRAFTSSPSVQDVVNGLGMYVVEPTGWRAVDEPGVRDGLFEHLVDVEEQHLRSTLELLEAVDDWRLLAHIITLPDRVSHAFWSFHEPDAYPERSAEELAASRSKVIDAYRESDRLLGELLKHLDRNTTVLIASDHGTAAHNPPYGGHRPEGIFVASGPGVDVGRERLTMSILDVTPVALALLGLPTGEDLPGSPPENLLASTEGLDTITTYEVGGAQRKPAKKTIDETTREQLRGLGYVE